MAFSLVDFFRLFVLISACVFSAAMLLAAPFELWQVNRVQHWTRVPARMVEAGYRRADFEPYETYAYFRFVDLQSGRTIEASDVRPGDMPFSVSFMGLRLFDSKGTDLKTYAAGKNFTAFRSADNRYFLENGSPWPMTGLLILSLS